MPTIDFPMGPMYTRVTGDKYEGWKSAKEIAALVRAEIKDLVKAGEIPAFTYGVRTSRACSSVHITVKNAPSAWVWCWGRDRYGITGWKWTEQAEILALRLESLVKQWCRDTTDYQTDYFDVMCYANASYDVDTPELDVTDGFLR